MFLIVSKSDTHDTLFIVGDGCFLSVAQEKAKLISPGVIPSCFSSVSWIVIIYSSIFR